MGKKPMLFICGLLFFLLVGCGQAKPDMYIENKAYNLTPQEYIDAINSNVTATGDDRYLTIPDFEASEAPIDIDFIYLTVSFTTDDNGKINKIFYSWDGTRKNVGYSVGLYCGKTLDMISPKNVDSVWEKLDIMNTASNNYKTSVSDNGTLYSYQMMGSGQFNFLTITPGSE